MTVWRQSARARARENEEARKGRGDFIINDLQLQEYYNNNIYVSAKIYYLETGNEKQKLEMLCLQLLPHYLL